MKKSRVFSYQSVVNMTLILAMSFILSACSLPEPQKSDDTVTASFVVSSVEGKSRSIENSGRISLPETRTYEFKACLQDRAHLKPLSSQQVRIKENNETVWSDPSGCIKWTENINFNYLENPEWLTIARTLEGQGYHQGETVIQFAVNPWELPGDSTDVIDLKNTSADKLKLASKKSSEKISAFIKSVIIEKLSQSVQANGLQVKHVIRIEPTLERFNLKNEKVSVSIPAKELKVRAVLRSENKIILDQILNFENREGSFQAEVTILHDGATSNDSKTTAELTLQEEQLSKIASTSVFNLGLGTDWIQGMESKAIATGTTTIGETGTLGNGNSPVTSVNNENSSGALNKSGTDSENGSSGGSSTAADSKSPILFDQIQSQVVKTISEKEASRSLMFSLKTCAKNTVTGKSLNNAQIKIDGWQSFTHSVTTDNNGCFSVEIPFAFQESSCHGAVSETLSLTINSNVKLDIPVFINPWNTTPVLDGRYIDESSLTKCNVNNENKGKLAGQKIEKDMLLAKMQVTPLEQTVRVGNLLELNVKKKIRWEMSPLLAIKGEANAQNTYSPVRDETWNVELLIQNPWTPASIKKVHYSKTEVKSLSGLILWETLVETNDLQTMDGLLDVFVRFENKSGTHSSGILRGRIILGADGSTLNLEEFKGNWDAMVAWTVKQDSLKKLSVDNTDKAPNLDNYAKVNSLTKTTINPFALTGVSDIWKAKKLSAHYANAMRAAEFCRQFIKIAHGKGDTATTKNWVTYCATEAKKNFRHIFKVNPVYEVTTVTDSKILKTEQKQIALTDGYTNSFTFSESWRHGVEVAGHAAATAGHSKSPVSAGLAGGYEVSWMEGISKDKSIRQTVTEGKTVLVSHYEMQTTADTSSRCMSIQLNPSLYEMTGKKLWFLEAWDFIKNPSLGNFRSSFERAIGSKNILTLQKGILICEPHVKKYNLKDDYFILSEDRRNTSLQNSNDPNSKPWFMAVRSKGDYQHILAILTSNIPVPQDYTYTNETVQRLLLETNYFEAVSSRPQVWVNPPSF